MNILQAYQLAANLHDGQLDKAGRPYIEHLTRVFLRVLEAGGDLIQQIAALLHDSIEDKKATPQHLLSFGVPSESISIILALSKKENETYEEYLIGVRGYPRAIPIKEGDLDDNSDPKRFEKLPEAVAFRLKNKYANARKILKDFPNEVPMRAPKTDRFLASFQSVDIRPEHRNHGDETPCLRDCGIAPAIASKLIDWAENVVGAQSLVCTFNYRNSGKSIKTWHWMPAFLQAAFLKHTEMFGDDDLPEAARRMRDTGSCWE